MSLRVRAVRHLAMIVVAALLVNACAPASSAPGQSTAAAGATPRSGGTLVYGLDSTVTATTDLLRASTSNLAVGNVLYERLYQAKASGGVEPGLVDKTVVSDDGLTWTITLRSGVKFHDGSSFDAAAVKTNLEVRKSSPTFQLKGQLAVIKDIIVVSPTTVQLVLTEPTPALNVVLSAPAFGMQSPAAMTAYPSAETYRTHASGTAPFKLESVTDQEVTLVRFADYWGPKAYLDRIVFKVIPDASARVAALEAGDVNVVESIAGPDFERLQKEGKVTVASPPAGASILYLWINNAKAPLNDKRVRQAIAMALNRQSYLGTQYGLADLADSVVPPILPGYAKMTPIPYDTAKAKQLLADAGLSPGFPIQIATYGLQSSIDVAQLVKQDLDGVGLSASVRAYPSFADWVPNLNKSAADATWQLAVHPAGYPYNDAEAVLIRHFLSTNEAPKGSDWMHYKNPQVDALLAQQGATSDPVARAQLLKQVQQLIWDDLPLYPLLALRQPWGTSKSVRDLTFTGPSQPILSRVWLQQ